MKLEDITVKQALGGVFGLLAVIGSGSGGFAGGSAILEWVERVNDTAQRLEMTQLHLCKLGHLTSEFCDLFVPGYEEKPELYRVYSARAHDAGSSVAAVDRIRREFETPRPNHPDGR